MKAIPTFSTILVSGQLLGLLLGLTNATDSRADYCDPISCGADVTGGIGAGSFGGTTSISSPPASNPALSANYGQNSAYEAYPSLDPGGFYSGSGMSGYEYTFMDNPLQNSIAYQLSTY